MGKTVNVGLLIVYFEFLHFPRVPTRYRIRYGPVLFPRCKGPESETEFETSGHELMVETMTK